MTRQNKVGATNAGKDDPRSLLRRRDRGKDDAWVAAFMKRSADGSPKTARSRMALGES